MIKQMILSVDFLGDSPCLYYKKRTKFETIYTGLLSLIVILFSLVCVGYFGREIFDKTKPTVTVSREVFPDFDEYQLNNKELMIATTLEFKNFSYYLDPTIYQISAENLIMTNGTFTANKQLEIDKCSNIYTQDDIIEKNIQIPLDLFYCLKPNQTSIRGYWGSEHYSTVKFYINKCQNSTNSNVTCRPKEEIDDYIQDGYIAFGFTTYEIDQINYTSPFKRIFYDLFNMLNAKASINFNIELSPDYFISENGLIFEDFTEYIGYTPEIEIFNSFKEGITIASVRLEGNSLGRTLHRSYIKLQDILTQIGGFIKSIILIANFITLFISKSFYLVYNLHELDQEKLEKTSSNKLETTVGPTNIPKKNTNYNHNIFESKATEFTPIGSGKLLNSSSKKIKGLASRPLEKLTSNNVYKDLFVYMFNIIKCKRKEKINKYVLGLDNVLRQCLSVETILEKYFEIEILKERVFADLNIEQIYKNSLIKTISSKNFVPKSDKIFYNNFLEKTKK